MVTREIFLESLSTKARCGRISAGMDLVCEYASARHYLLARYDLPSSKQLDFVLTSDWPFDLVRSLGAHIVTSHGRNSEFSRCLAAYEPSFIKASDAFTLPDGICDRVCVLPFNVGEARLVLLLLFEAGLFLSHDRLRDIAVVIAYHTANFSEFVSRSDRVSELTEREIECLSWIGEGKTSDEIALIIGISRNTVNNYITSIMNKTGARTRSEAVAFAVRHQII